MRKRTNYKHQKKGKKMKQQKRKKEKLHGKFIDELWEEENKRNFGNDSLSEMRIPNRP